MANFLHYTELSANKQWWTGFESSRLEVEEYSSELGRVKKSDVEPSSTTEVGGAVIMNLVEPGIAIEDGVDSRTEGQTQG